MELFIKEIKELVVEASNREQMISVLESQRDAFYHKLNDLKMNITVINTRLEKLRKDKGIISSDMIQLMITLNKESIFKYQDVNYDKKTQEVLMEEYEDAEKIIETYWDWKALILEAVTEIINGVEPNSEEGKSFGKKWLDMISKVTNGDLEILEAHKKSFENRDKWPEEDRRLMEFSNDFIDKCVEEYISQEKRKEI